MYGDHYLSKGYIQRYCTGPPNIASYAKWTGKCSMQLKNPGGKILSNLQRIIGIFTSICSNLFMSNTVEHKALKNWLISVRGFQTYSDSASNAIESKFSMNTWQSWLFKLVNFTPSTYTQLAINEEYPSNILNFEAHSHISLLYSILN